MKMLTVKQAAEILGVHRSRVRVLIREGRLPAQKVGRDWIIMEPDLELVKDRKPGRPAKPQRVRISYSGPEQDPEPQKVRVSYSEPEQDPDPKRVRVTISKIGDKNSGPGKPPNKGG